MNAGRYTIDHGEDYAVITFGEGFDMLSSAPGGGFREGIRRISVGKEEDGAFCIMPPEGTKVTVRSGSFGRTSVTVVAASDLRSGIGRAAEACPRAGGTHVVVIMDSDMPVSAMARATMTAEEAVTVVIQDLVLSCDEGGSAGSGSAVLSITSVRNTVSDLYLHGAGKHSKLGELIGTCTRNAVRESAERNGMTPELTGSVERRFSRLSGERDLSLLDGVDGDPETLALASACLFVSDENRWGLVPDREARDAVRDILEAVLGGPEPDVSGGLPEAVFDAIERSIR